MWADAGAGHAFSVRGGSYMEDRVKASPGPALGTLVAALLYRCRPGGEDGERVDHLLARQPAAGLVAEIGKLTAPYRAPNEPCLFAANIQVPGSPCINVVLLFLLPTCAAERGLASTAADRKFGQVWRRYYEDLPVGPAGLDPRTAPPDAGTCPPDHFRNQRFKLVPRLVDGPWVVKSALPQKPALLGTKLTQRYFRGECYVETDVHVGSSVVANNITGLCRGFSARLDIEMGFLLEGRDEAELPEKVRAEPQAPSLHRLWHHLQDCQGGGGGGGGGGGLRSGLYEAGEVAPCGMLTPNS